ncbi:MAG TPA: PEP/pyruvate-binding domain-containing protein [Lentimicrobium sp.]|nr:PEP/pyruvate-binding domain-containing protein [Lentimicrobium sp.]
MLQADDKANNSTNKIDVDKLLHLSKERVKELQAINDTTSIIKKAGPIQDTLAEICSIIPSAWQYPEATVARIVFDDMEFATRGFVETEWKQEQKFQTIDNMQGLITVCYLREFPKMDEGPFMFEERNLILNLASLIEGYLNGIKGKEGSFVNRERLKELSAINQTTAILRSGKPIEEAIHQICLIMPKAWQYPEFAVCRIRYADIETSSADFRETQWVQKQSFETIDNQSGSIEIYYLKAFPASYEGPFLEEERHLIINIANLITGFLNSIKGKAIIKMGAPAETVQRPSHPENVKYSRQLLQTFLNRSNYNRDIYHDLMPFKVKEILLVANLYDAYSIEKEGRFSEHVLGEFYQLSLSTMPRITGVSSEEEIYEQLGKKHYDLVIIMMGVDKQFPVEISRKIKEHYSYIPVFLLLNSNTDIAVFDKTPEKLTWIDKIFVWNGDSKIFFAMINYLEDKINVENDTKIGITRVILVVEDSPKYYSLYLPMLYNIVLEQTKHIIEDVTTDELYRILRLKARPKIMLASTYEEAMYVFNKYKDYILCLITDVKFKKDGRLHESAGIKLVQQMRKEIKELPIMIQSSDAENVNKAYELQTSFINKNSETLLQDFRSFITHYLGFGNFIYRNKDGQQIAVARSLKEFQDFLSRIPIESLLYHAKKNHFSMWLMARGEIQVAKILNPAKVSDFKDPESLREYLISVIQHFRNEQNIGKVIPFEESAITDEKNIISLTEGALGGKGRGLAFINTLIYNYDFSRHVPNINLRAPKTSIIGTDEFEYFIDRNNLRDVILGENNYDEIKSKFLEAKLTGTLIKRLRTIIKSIPRPLAIRSSGLFEDSLNQPFAGIFETYLIPNSHPDEEVRLQQLMDAIKLVYASVYSDTARGYIKAINYKIEQEKMAVVIQEVVGNQYGDVYYPHISGVAQSYNYYPFGHMKPEEGFAVCALGLGRYVVEGEKAYRFSPLYPNLEINSPKDQYKGSQVKFYAVDLKKQEVNLLEGEEAGLRKLDIYDAEVHGTLKHLASVYSLENNRISPGLNQQGPRVVNFADILKYNYIPLAKTIEVVLDVVKEALGSPVEIEFAVDLNKDQDNKATFYILQIKPLIGNANDYQIEMSTIKDDDIVLYSEKEMGNGLIDDIEYIIFVDPDTFDKGKTEEMAREIDKINARMIQENKKYILIGPGRWGTRDKWIGIPVTWPQISNANIIVETSLEGFPLDASSGSHFFHNVTSMNVGYFSIQPEMSGSFIRYDMIKKHAELAKNDYFTIARFPKPLTVKMDGKKRIAVITINNEVIKDKAAKADLTALNPDR